MKGFSIVEIIVVIAIISIIGSVSVVTYNTLRRAGDVKHASYVFADALKEAKNKAKIMDSNTDWGVNLINNNVIIFSGSSYASRDTSKDKSYEIPNNLIITGPLEIVFNKFSGLPIISGNIIFTNDFGTSTVSVSTNGVVTY